MFILSLLPISPNPESPTKPWEPLINPSTDFWVLAKTIREVDIPPPPVGTCVNMLPYSHLHFLLKQIVHQQEWVRPGRLSSKL